MTSDDMVMVPRALLFDLRCYGDINTVEGVLYGRSHRDRLREADEILAGASPVPPSPPRDDDDVRDRVADCRVENADSGHWRSCSGCYETEDEHPTGPYPFSESFGCYLGSGCSECGGIGAIWDTTVSNMRDPEIVKANAHLISSAPEMFEALAHIDAYYDMNDLDEREDDDAIEVPVGDLRRARSALKKARGEGGMSTPFTEFERDDKAATGVLFSHFITAVGIYVHTNESNRTVSVDDIAKAFNTTVEIAREAVDDHPWLFVHDHIEPALAIVESDGE